MQPVWLLCITCRIRMTGSAALNMCHVACGQADAFYEYGVHCWDIAAGDIIVREAGGVCMFPTGYYRYSPCCAYHNIRQLK